MTQISKARNELEAMAQELALVAPYADEYPEHYQAVYDAWVRAQEHYDEVLRQQSVEDSAPLWCDAEDLICDGEDYDHDEEPRSTPAPPVPAAPTEHHVSGEGGVVDVGDDQGEDQDEDETFGPDNPYRLEDLTRDAVPAWLDVTEDQYFEFKREVYRECVRRAARGRRFVREIPPKRLGTLRGNEFNIDLVADGESLMVAAEAALVVAQAEGDARALLVTNGTIALASAYRSADTQFGLWDGRFTGTYVTRHRASLQQLPGEALAQAWVNLLAREIGGATATPGYSLHQRGISLDFRSPQPGVTNEKTATAMRRWRGTWFYDWLVAHAHEYGFEPYDGEAWHWNYTALMNEDD